MGTEYLSQQPSGVPKPKAGLRARFLVCGVLVVVHLVLAAAVIMSPVSERGRAASDQLNYHEPTIRLFAETWPDVDLSDYWSATTPLYHWVMAGVLQVFEPTRPQLQLVGTLWTAGLIVVVTAACVRRVGVWSGGMLVLPILASLYVFPQGVWLLPDNAAWLGVAIVLLLGIRISQGQMPHSQISQDQIPQAGPENGQHAADQRTRQQQLREVTKRLVVGGTVLLALVLTRQVHLWAAGVLIAAAWLAVGERQGTEKHVADDVKRPVGGVFAGVFAIVQEIGRLFHTWPRRLVLLGTALSVVAPAFIVVWLFILLWEGLVPPIYQGYYAGSNPATPAFVLTLIGGFGIGYVGWWLPGVWRRIRRPGGWQLFALAALFGLIVAVLPETSYDKEAGRWTGLWNLVRAVPLIAGRTSPIVLVLAPAGMVILTAYITSLPRTVGWVMFTAVAGFTAAQSASFELWQRYHEPFVLIWLAIASASVMSTAARSTAGGVDRIDRSARFLTVIRFVGLGVIMLGLASLTVKTLGSGAQIGSLPLGAYERAVQAEPLRFGPEAEAPQKNQNPETKNPETRISEPRNPEIPPETSLKPPLEIPEASDQPTPDQGVGESSGE